MPRSKRVAHHGDGWLGIWNSPKRFAQARDIIAAEAERSGRRIPSIHGMQVWCGIADRRADARAGLAAAMEGFYGIPFGRFEKYSPYGTPEDVADFLRGLRRAGVRVIQSHTDQRGYQHCFRGSREDPGLAQRLTQATDSERRRTTMTAADCHFASALLRTA